MNRVHVLHPAPGHAIFTLRMGIPPVRSLPPMGSPSILRREIETAIERMIDALDALDGDPDFEESGDGEPSLCWPIDGRTSHCADSDDGEEDAGEQAEIDDEGEPSLGSSPSLDQATWAQGHGDLWEDHEPSLGWPNAGPQLPRYLVGSNLTDPGLTESNLDREYDEDFEMEIKS